MARPKKDPNAPEVEKTDLETAAIDVNKAVKVFLKYPSKLNRDTVMQYMRYYSQEFVNSFNDEEETPAPKTPSAPNQPNGTQTPTKPNGQNTGKMGSSNVINKGSNKK